MLFPTPARPFCPVRVAVGGGHAEAQLCRVARAAQPAQGAAAAGGGGEVGTSGDKDLQKLAVFGGWERRLGLDGPCELVCTPRDFGPACLALSREWNLSTF